MKIKDIESLRIDINEIEIDITPIIEQKFYDSKACDNFREDSVNYLISNTMNFHSTPNNFLILMKRFVKIICPKCKREMPQKGSGGIPSAYIITYDCSKCKTKLSISVNPEDAIHINFDKSNQPSERD